MKKVLKWLGLALGAVVLLLAGFAAFVASQPLPTYAARPVALRVQVTPEAVARGKRHVELLCAGCHFNSGTGGLTGKQMLDLPPQFGRAYSKNITADPVKGIGSWTDGEIAFLIRTGISRDGRYTPPWMPKLPNASHQDIEDVIAFLRSDDPLVRAQAVDDRESEPSFLTKALSRVAFKPFAYPEQPIVTPPASDPVAFGRYLATARLGCFACHSADFKTNDELQPERSAGYFGGGNAMPDIAGKIVYTSNLTPDRETGIGRWNYEQFRRALVDGIGIDNKPLRFPMVPARILEEQEVAAIYAYLKTVPPVRNPVPSPEPFDVAAEGDRGKQVFYRYGCNACHGDSGLGQYDLRQGPARYPTDDALVAYIKHPERVKPGIAMPTWDGVIQEDEYAPLAGYVRTLAVPVATR
jgi:mono/diheme cytochrome c family protein